MARKSPEYLSPSAISLFRHDIDMYYLHYLADNSPGREPQDQAMAIGSAFDAYAKSYLHEKLFGRGNDPRYEFDNIFQAQVEPQWRDWAKLHGLYVFEDYRANGVLADLLTELQQAVNVPKFEIEVRGVIHNQREHTTAKKGGVMFLGKPDVFFINAHGAHVVIDWKVNGYLSKSPKSPMPGYVRLRGDKKKCGAHKDAVVRMHNGVMINSLIALEEVNIDWATQLSVYAWLLGCDIGEDFIAGIDQVCCAPNGTEFPDLRYAEHRMIINPNFQRETFAFAQDIWLRTRKDDQGKMHFFTEMTFEDSESRCAMLDKQVLDFAQMDPMFLALSQGRIR